MYEHRCLENTNKLYTSAGKYDDQLQFKAITEESMVSNPEILSYTSPMSPGTTMIVRTHSARKSICLSTEFLDVKKKLLSAG